MNWKQRVREPKMMSLALIMGTLAIGILIGTLMHNEVRADKGQDKPVTDAIPLKIPSPVKLQNEFTAIVNKDARFAILDLTGVDAVDTRTAGYIIEMIKAIRLLGAEGIVTGIRRYLGR